MEYKRSYKCGGLEVKCTFQLQLQARYSPKRQAKNIRKIKPRLEQRDTNHHEG